MQKLHGQLPARLFRCFLLDMLTLEPFGHAKINNADFDDDAIKHNIERFFATDGADDARYAAFISWYWASARNEPASPMINREIAARGGSPVDAHRRLPGSATSKTASTTSSLMRYKTGFASADFSRPPAPIL